MNRIQHSTGTPWPQTLHEIISTVNMIIDHINAKEQAPKEQSHEPYRAVEAALRKYIEALDIGDAGRNTDSLDVARFLIHLKHWCKRNLVSWDDVLKTADFQTAETDKKAG